MKSIMLAKYKLVEWSYERTKAYLKVLFEDFCCQRQSYHSIFSETTTLFWAPEYYLGESDVISKRHFIMGIPSVVCFHPCCSPGLFASSFLWSYFYFSPFYTSANVLPCLRTMEDQSSQLFTIVLSNPCMTECCYI